MATDNVGLSLKLFIVLTRALQSIKKRIEEDIKKQGINLTEFAVLELLFHKGDQPIQKIGSKVLLSSSSISYVVDRLVQKEMIRRRPCPEDRRITFATLTDKGRAFMEDYFPKHEQAIHGILAGLDDDEKAQVIEHIKTLGLYAEGTSTNK
ncbi:MarR family transcriptional regulator, 2-MHQ and catechol-resistance regulon repressor [Terribacillus halophilus]|uniref:MarR family transcriptional regulator, 2-MHQ and catechol-resistance regulon repressor n=1 Tax=Terribacillus halophilus TaxID=361279 RepID=A0A1G6KIY8_9BACI|nr:MarR family transcriptional regulator [Terribacillus halophilus]SDC30286.1 MarR family transcriptional regulator, 2-MHQ and catechol-resistance regulon repressor [Terribacillus halophilus]